MKVILMKDVKGTGKKGDVVDVSDGFAKNFLLKNGVAKIANASNLNVNSLQKDNDDIRSSMLPTIIRAMLVNKRYADSYGLFEIGHVVTGLDKDNLAVEEQMLGMGWTFNKADLEKQLLEVKDCLHYVLGYTLKLPLKLAPTTPTQNYLCTVNAYNIVNGEKVVGIVGVVHPEVQHKIDKDKYMIVAEVNMTDVNTIDSYDVTVEKVSKFPITTLDFNFVLGQEDVYGTIENVANMIETDLTYKVQLLDIFLNKTDNTKSYTLRYFVTSMDHTLSSAEIENFHKTVINTFENNNIYLKAE